MFNVGLFDLSLPLLRKSIFWLFFSVPAVAVYDETYTYISVQSLKLSIYAIDLPTQTTIDGVDRHNVPLF